MNAWQCPNEYDLANADRNQLPSQCNAPVNGQIFTVEGYLNGKYPLTTGDNKSGQAYWQNMRGEFVQITSPIDGLATPRVFCRGALSSGSQFETAEIPANGGTFAYNLLANEQLICTWYEVKAAGATVIINAHLCPSSGPSLANADMNTLASTCTQTAP